MTEQTQKTVFITGAAGYVGEMLCEQWSKRADIRLIVALDKEPITKNLAALKKVVYLEQNLADQGWQLEVAKYEPAVVVHTAWQIRAIYGNAEKQWRWNVEGSDKVFDFALNLPSVKRLIYFSTASGYGARSDNTFDHFFTEAEGFRDDDYIYAKEKQAAEAHLKERYEQAVKAGRMVPQVTILRPAAITGPRGRLLRIRFGLQSALSGNLKGNPIYRLVTLLTSFVPATRGWARQFVHEDDVNDAVTLFAFGDSNHSYEVYNLTPTGEAVYAKDMAAAVGKKILPVTPAFVRAAFAFFWHATRGRIPTCPGAWRFYSYPVLMNGEKLAGVYRCRYSGKDSFQYTAGRYEEQIPANLRKNK